MSALRSSAGPAVWTKSTSSSAATIWASEVLPRPGGPASSTWSSASPRARGGLDRDAELRLQRLLADELVEPARAQRDVELLVRRARASARRDALRSRACGSARSPARLLQRVGDQVLGRLAGAPSSSSSASCAEKPSPTRPSRASSRGSSPRRDHDRIVGRRGADLLAQLDDDPLRRALADALARPAAARCRRRRRRRAARAAAPPESTASATFGPTDWTPISSRKRSRSASVAKP